MFVDNKIQACQSGYSINKAWNLSCEGNYWSDWQEPDNNYDGIVDLPYEIAGDAGAKDYSPLTYIPAAPTVPQELNATPGNRFVCLEWKEPVYCGASNITGYRVYRATEPDRWIFVAQTKELNYTDANLTNGLTYYYYVTALNSHGESRKSETVNATPGEIPGIPENVRAYSFEKKAVLRWEMPNSTGGLPITGYTIYRSTFPRWQTLYVDAGNVTEFVDGCVEPNTTYYYRIAAVNIKGEGERCGVVSATTSGLNVSMVLNNQVLGPGENATVAVYVGRNATREPLAGAHVVLSIVNLTGSVELADGYTNASGIFTTKFIAGCVRSHQNGSIRATVFADNYSTVTTSTAMTLLPAEKESAMKLIVEAGSKIRNGLWKVNVYVVEATTGKPVENAGVEVRLSTGAVAMNRSDASRRAVFEFLLDAADAPVVTAEISQKEEKVRKY
ncbi:MAG: fibronectin type III domain-containing protein [Thermoplasmata archaeon]|nr:fibronectin type III domain-containing protein [Thermoplasmata archaeon]